MNKLSVRPRNMIRIILLGLILIGVAVSYHYYSYSIWGNDSVVEASTNAMKSDAHVIVTTDNTKTTTASEAPIATAPTAPTAVQPMVTVATATLPQTSDNGWQAIMLMSSGMIGIGTALAVLNSRRVKAES